MELLAPVRVRFTEPEDVAKYGGDWVTYDEAKIARLPLADLAAIEAQIGMSVAKMMLGFREGKSLASAAVIWVARGMALPDDATTEDFADFKPLIMLADWEIIKPEPEPEVTDPLDLDSDCSKTDASMS